MSIAAGVVRPGRARAGGTTWRESFDGGTLDVTRWVTTRDGDFRESVVDVVDASPQSARDLRLRLRADTRGTRDDTVKFLGAGTVRAFPVTAGTRIAVTLDWNGQANGSYLSAALILSPEATRVNPLRGRRWLKVEYVGVPPGQTARLAVALSAGGRERTLYDEGWPEVDRAGRAIGIQELILVFQGASFEVWENGERLLAARDTPLGFDVAHVYLQLSSHSNYPPREIFFDELRVSGPDSAEP